MTPLVLLWALVVLVTGLVAAATWIAYRTAVERRRAAAMRALVAFTARAGLPAPAAGGAVRTVKQWLPRRLRVALARADLHPSVRQVATGIALGVGVSAAVLVLHGAVPAALAFCLLAAGAWWGIERLGDRRRKEFVDSLPAFLDGVRQLIKVGNSLLQAVQKATDTAPPAITRYFQPVIVQCAHGVPLGDAIPQLADRLDVAELHMLSAAIHANLRFGGRIGDILANLIRILRDRRQIEHEISANTAETRMTAVVLGALPFVVAGWIAVNDPAFADFFLNDPSGHGILSVVVPMQVVGLLAIRRIVAVDY